MTAVSVSEKASRVPDRGTARSCPIPRGSRRAFGALAAMLLAAGPLQGGTLAPITGYGDLHFGISRSVAEAQYPNCRWEGQDQGDDAQLWSAEEPDIRGIDQIDLLYVGGSLSNIAMRTRTVTSNTELLAAWDRYRSVFTSQYGSPSTHVELMLSPYDDTRSEFVEYGMEALRAGKCVYAVSWTDGTTPNAPAVTILMKPGWLKIVYESTLFQDWSDRISTTDAGAF